MQVGKTFYARNRKQWRAWLAKHHQTAPDIWLVYYKKESGKPRVPYNHAVEEALCYGWIDSIMKPIDAQCFAQRFSPRRPTSQLSEMNRERVRRLQRDPAVWKHFRRFPESYRRIRIGWITAARHRPEIFQQRLRYFLKMTAQNKRFGMVQ